MPTPTTAPLAVAPVETAGAPTATATLVIQEDTPMPTQTPRVTPTHTPTRTPAATPTPRPTLNQSATPARTPGAPTAIRPPTATFTRRPPTLTFTPRPPTLTFTPAPPPTFTYTPVPLYALSFRWINGGRPYDENECFNFLNGTRVVGKLRRPDGSLIIGQVRTAIMHQWIRGDSTGPFAYPGAYRDFPLHNDGSWDAEFPRRAQDFEWHIYISAKASDDPISADLSNVSSAHGNCGQPGTRNYFSADWIAN